MRKIIFHLSTGFAGMDATDNGSYPDDVTTEELDNDAWQRAIQHAESYGIYPDSDLEDISAEDYDHLVQSGDADNYTDNIDGWWEDYDPEKHDGLVAGGGNWEWEEFKAP